MENLCRLCGNEYELMFNVFDDFCQDLRIHSKIMAALHIEVNAEDALPKKICADCHQRLDNVLTFINFCHDTQRRLEELYSVNENLLPVEHIERISRHGLNCSMLSSSSFELNKMNNETYHSQGDAGAELQRLPLSSEYEENIRENKSSPPISVVEQRTTADVIDEKLDTNATHSVPSKKDTLIETTVNKEVERDSKNKSEKMLKTYVESPAAAAPKKSKRVKISKLAKKIPMKMKKRKITSNFSDLDYLSGVELVREKKEWVCDTCQMTFIQEGLYMEHLNVHSGNRPYGCRLCSNSFRKRQELNQHIRTVHSDKQYKCAMCNYIAKHRGKLTEHQKNVHEKPFLCDQCTYRTGEKGKIHQHIANKHNGDLSYVCEICGLGFRTRPSLQAHRMNVHFPEPKVCPKCGIMCPSLSKYSAHVFRCGKEKERYACEKCDKSYVSKEVLKDHMNKHLNIKPYKCDVCSKGFHQRNRLDTHKYVHREAVYQCEVCSQSFNRKDNMKNHMKKHLYKPMKYDSTIVTAV